MKIISLNINDFGGCKEHLEEYKKIFKYQSIYKWDELDKGKNINGIFQFLKEINPEIIVLQEFDINSIEAKNFCKQMEDEGYSLNSETPSSKRPSMTVMFIKNSISYEEIKTCHVERYLRAYAIKTNGYIIYGIHVPPKFDNEFWNEIENFWTTYKNENLIMIGDINTINIYNDERLNKLLQNSVDIWYEKGHENKISKAGDHAIISKNINIETVAIETNEDLLEYTDHPALILTLN